MKMVLFRSADKYFHPAVTMPQEQLQMDQRSQHDENSSRMEGQENILRTLH